LEHRGAGTLLKASDRGQSWLLFWRRLRDFARLRFPYRVGDLLLRLARAKARPNSRLRRLGALAENRRHHADQGDRDAIAAHPWPPGARLGHCERMRVR